MTLQDDPMVIFAALGLSPFQGKKIEDLDIKDGIIFEKANPKNTLPVRKSLIAHSRPGYIQSKAGPSLLAIWPPEPARSGRISVHGQAGLLCGGGG